MATQNVEGVVTLEELMVSSLATADALAKSLSGAGSYSLRRPFAPRPQAATWLLGQYRSSRSRYLKRNFLSLAPFRWPPNRILLAQRRRNYVCKLIFDLPKE